MTDPEKTQGRALPTPGDRISQTRSPRRTARASDRRRSPRARPVFELEDVTVSYGGNPAVAEVSMRRHQQRDHRADRPLGLRQVDPDPLPQPDERPDPLGARRGPGALPRRGPLRRRGRPGRGPQADRDGLPEAEPVPEVDLRQHRLRPADPRDEGRHGRDRREGAARRGALGRGQGPPRRQRLRHVGRPAAAPLHRPLPRGRPRRDPDGRALLGARPDLDRQDRGPDAGAEGAATRS